MEFAVSRDGTTLITLHGGSDTTARDDATAELDDALGALATDGKITEWAVRDAEVYEHPTAPFDPYTITLTFSVTVTVEADEADVAADRGTRRIDDALERAELDSVSYTSSPETTAA
ncbi:hypothetical protein [Natrinema halophilum]|uniref:Uncharacterized protein n=1 Tax=Natrinema halophilum TaxID=1699371 RepID=A0A7D5GUX5_9EURY|nr:hypothetical protein [Natrinema halophilum]QLG51029.1 hypothetical protein HYG82_20445 [Natrinema halophilum]